MEENARYHITFLHGEEEVFKWSTTLAPVIPRENEHVFLVTDLPSRGQGQMWIVHGVTYQLYISESSAELNQVFTIHVTSWTEGFE